ncbi:phosphatase PAP2 family protein [Bacteroidales bacterium MB20-C3-3]|nr:phosphatase PAP2 family protein [Bacteroidales bacterium]MBP8677614.1 phosphatase PAP2 family protein [Bacteroidales bacterium]MBP9585147.1 phosphatase PAP2 family protein [Bacteroidales bacterium]WRQ33883.1 phosphatase PAP2 family protein [Bacteroidales bacterium MB20-C3-3]
MLDKIEELDRNLFLFFNNLHSAFFDWVMTLFSSRLPWLPLYIAIIFCIIWSCNFNKELDESGNYRRKINFHKRDTRTVLIIIFAIIATFVVTDYFSNQIKYFVSRLRPGWDPFTCNLARVIEDNRFSYGFVSGHASNVFGLAMLTSAIFKRRWYTILIFSWATIVSYSRIYVGRHFPGDVLFGALFGIAVGYLTYKILQLIFQKNVLRN